MNLAQRTAQIAQDRRWLRPYALMWTKEGIEAPVMNHRLGGVLLAQLVVYRLGTYGGGRV